MFLTLNISLTKEQAILKQFNIFGTKSKCTSINLDIQFQK